MGGEASLWSLAAVGAHLGTQSQRHCGGEPSRAPAAPDRSRLDPFPHPLAHPSEVVAGFQSLWWGAQNSLSFRQAEPAASGTLVWTSAPLSPRLLKQRARLLGQETGCFPDPAASSSSSSSGPRIQELCRFPSLSCALRPGRPTSLHPPPAHARAGGPRAGLEPWAPPQAQGLLLPQANNVEGPTFWSTSNSPTPKTPKTQAPPCPTLAERVQVSCLYCYSPEICFYYEVH